VHLSEDYYVDWRADFLHIPTRTYYEVCSSPAAYSGHKLKGDFDLLYNHKVRLVIAFFIQPDVFVLKDYYPGLQFPKGFGRLAIALPEDVRSKLKTEAMHREIELGFLVALILTEYTKRKEGKEKSKRRSVLMQQYPAMNLKHN